MPTLMVSLRSGARPRPGARFVFRLHVCTSFSRYRGDVDIVAGVLAGRREISIYRLYYRAFYFILL